MTQRQSQVTVLSINMFAKLCKTTPRTIRFYEQKGLLFPKKINPDNSYRYYSPNQVKQFMKIKLLQNFHISLKEIKQIIQNKKGSSFFEDKINNLKNEIKEKERQKIAFFSWFC